MERVGNGTVIAGTTNSVTLGDGSVAENVLPATGTSARWAMEVPAPVSCHTCALGPGVNPAMPTSTEAAGLPASCLLITMTVSAPSEARRAAKAATVSGSGATAETLVSPNVDFAPS